MANLPDKDLQLEILKELRAIRAVLEGQASAVKNAQKQDDRPPGLLGNVKGIDQRRP